MRAQAVERLIERGEALLSVEDQVGRSTAVEVWCALEGPRLEEQLLAVLDPEKGAGREVVDERLDELVRHCGIPDEVPLSTQPMSSSPCSKPMRNGLRQRPDIEADLKLAGPCPRTSVLLPWNACGRMPNSQFGDFRQGEPCGGTNRRSGNVASGSCSRRPPTRARVARRRGQGPKQLGIGPESLRHWVHQEEVEVGTRAGLTNEERARIKELEREVRELRWAKQSACSSV